MALAVAAALPVLLFAGVTAQRLATAERQAMVTKLEHRSEEATDKFERYLHSLQELAITLAASRSVQTGDLPAFYDFARRTVEATRLGRAVVLLDPGGKLLLATNQPFGNALPITGTMEILAETVASKAPVITDLFTSSVSGEQVFGVMAPVVRDGQVTSVVMIVVTPKDVIAVLNGEHLPEGWSAMVIDHRNVIVAHTPEELTGHKILPETAAGIEQGSRGSFTITIRGGVTLSIFYVKLPQSGWTMAVGVPKGQLETPAANSRWFILALGLASLSMAAVLAFLVGRYMDRQIASVALAAVALGDGLHPAIGTSKVREFQEVAGALVATRDLIDARDAALYESEARFRLFVEHAPAAIAMFDRDMRYLALSGRWQQEFQLDGSPFGRNHYDLFPEVSEAWRVVHRRCLAGAVEHSDGERSERADGSVRWLKWEVRPWHDTNGAIGGLLMSSEDVTEQKRAEEALRESVDRLRLAMKGARLGVRETDLVTNQGSWSEEAASILGCGYNGDTSFDAWVAAVHPDDLARARAEWDHALSSPEHSYETEYRFRQSDGSWRWIGAYGHAVFEEGRPIRGVVVLQDISARKHDEEALRQSETRLQLAREAAGFGVWDRDLVAGTMLWSEDQWRLHGLEPQPGAPDPETWRACFHPEDLGRMQAERAAALANDGTELVDSEYRVILPSGEVRWLLGKTKLLRGSDGAVARAVGVTLDVTASRQTEADLRRLADILATRVRDEVAAREAAQLRAAHAERMQALGQLAGGIAHDFNNVLQAVSGALSLIARRPDDQAGIRRMAQLAMEATERGASITRRLLAVGRRGDLRAEAIDPATLLNDLREILTHTLGTNIDVQIRVEPGLRRFLADKAQLETSLINLATNARDAMPNGGELILSAAVEIVHASASGHPDGLDPGRFVRLTIQDAGVGMDAATLARASEPFFTTKTVGAGTGLGLSMAKGFAEQSGGAMRVESVPGRSTTITLWLPETDPASVPGTAKPQVPANTAGSGIEAATTSVRVLVVDDENAVREVLALHLEDAGFAVLEAGSGAEVLGLLAAGETVDAVITDLSMPGMDGIAVIRAVQGRYPDLPAILLTGYAGDGAALAVGGAIKGAFTLLRKPVRGEQLVDRLQALLAGQTDAIRDGGHYCTATADAERDGVAD
jgi:PAS domain S-box-containing protein